MTRNRRQINGGALLNITNSCLEKKWVLRCSDENKIKALSDIGLTRTTAQILAGRNIEPEHAKNFLSPKLKNYLPNPSSLQDMDKAACFIWDSIEAGKTITIFADYDVDGASSAAQLINWGRAINQKFGLYVPDRIKEGFGPNSEALAKLKSAGSDLVITVDCGATAGAVLQAAQNLGLDIIVIDHHQMHGGLAECRALVNPNRADDYSGLGYLSAAGVVFMLLVALNREARKRGIKNLPDLKQFLDLVALGTICDVVPLLGLNRAFVAQGLKIMSNTPNSGIDILARIAGIKPPFSTYDCGFILGPRINAAGRIAQADMGARLLSETDEDALFAYAGELDAVNQQRKIIQEKMLEEAIGQANKQLNNPLICVAMQEWHIGVIGIVAGRLKDKFSLPAIVIGIDDGEGKGSARSISGIDIGAVINAAVEEGILLAGGGHEMAAGFSIEPDKISEFEKFVSDKIKKAVEQAQQNKSLVIDALISASAVNESLVSEIEKIAPFGAKMPEPVFALANMRISYAERLKAGHVRCAFEDSSGIRVAGIAFGAEDTGIADILLKPNPPNVHIAVKLKRNVWNGHTKIDMHIKDLVPA